MKKAVSIEAAFFKEIIPPFEKAFISIKIFLS